jgi:sugar O-acyltransferase (sialic acid O-acetyltransferase NeuD family)
MEKVVIFGATQIAVLSHFYLTHDSPHEVVAFTVDQDYLKEETLCGLPVVPFEDIESIYPPGEYKMRIALGFRDVNKLRAKKYHQAKEKGYELINYISSTVITWSGLVVGDNCFIGEGAVIEPFAQIGNNVFIGSGTLIGHNSVIKDHCFVASHAVVLGCVTIEPYCVLGANATIKDGVTLASDCIVGAGALITTNTREKGVYIAKTAELAQKPSDELGSWLTWSVQ